MVFITIFGNEYEDALSGYDFTDTKHVELVILLFKLNAFAKNTFY